MTEPVAPSPGGVRSGDAPGTASAESAVRVIIHDFNNALFAIQGYADILSEDLAAENRARFDPEAALRNLDALRQAADRATTLTARLLALSRQDGADLTMLDLDTADRKEAPG